MTTTHRIEGPSRRPFSVQLSRHTGLMYIWKHLSLPKLKHCRLRSLFVPTVSQYFANIFVSLSAQKRFVDNSGPFGGQQSHKSSLIQFGMRSHSIYIQNWHSVTVLFVGCQMESWPMRLEYVFGVCNHCDEIKSLFLQEWWLNICYASSPAGASGKLSLPAADIRLYWEGIPSSLTVGIPFPYSSWVRQKPSHPISNSISAC